ncbi:hypothetical protein C8Q80DRAFT_209836 [Daedaleopsis nitida]|nr:hypothetical protein C8Q80DRAFT_209836 [Daedaleopsis nitida]
MHARLRAHATPGPGPKSLPHGGETPPRAFDRAGCLYPTPSQTSVHTIRSPYPTYVYTDPAQRPRHPNVCADRNLAPSPRPAGSGPTLRRVFQVPSPLIFSPSTVRLVLCIYDIYTHTSLHRTAGVNVPLQRCVPRKSRRWLAAVLPPPIVEY